MGSGHRFVRLLALITIFSLVFPVAALADDISNKLDGTVDAVAEVMALNVGGPNGTTQLYVVPTNGDGKNGCNLTGSTTLVVAVASSDTTKATVSPASITFTSCGDTPTLTITPHDAGSATITLSQTSNSTAGTFDLAPATFIVNVAPPPNTAPQISVLGVTGGGSYEAGSVPAATCSVVDAEDGNSSFAATLGAISGPLAAYGLGEQTASCSYTDGGGLTASASVTFAIVDTTNPVITFLSRTPANTNGWNSTDVTVTWTCSDSGSGVVATTVSQTVSTEGADQSIPGTCEDHAGNRASDTVTGINIDKTPPTASLAVSAGTPGLDGWYTSDVTVSTSGSDTISPVACTADQFQMDETTGSVFTGSCTNAAGLTTDADPLTVKLDETGPSASLAVTAGGLGLHGWYTSAVTISTSGTDSISNPTTCTGDQYQTAETTGTEFHGSCTNDAGLTTEADSLNVKLDRSAPTVVYTSATTTPNASGWYNHDVTATFTATDGISGFAGGATATGTATTSAEGTAVTVGSPAFTDLAGNTAVAGTATSDPYQIDKTAPMVHVTGVTGGAIYLLGSVPAAGCETTETLSGVKTATSLSTSGGPVGSMTATCSAATDNADNTGAPASVTYSVHYPWAGFFAPVDNTPMLNTVKAGSAVPIKFSLGSYQGMSIFATGYPASAVFTCDSNAPTDAIEETVTAGSSGLSYDSVANQYVYVWKTDKAWAGSCRRLVVKLADGTFHYADFKLMK